MNECFSEPCLNGGTCIDLINVYICECAIGFAGDYCEEGSIIEVPIQFKHTIIESFSYFYSDIFP